MKLKKKKNREEKEKNYKNKMIRNLKRKRNADGKGAK